MRSDILKVTLGEGLAAQSFAAKTLRLFVETAEKPQSYKTILRYKAAAPKIRK